MRSRSAGALEALVMRALWTAGAPLNARAIQAAFDDPVPARTTVLTVLSRLETKGMVTRHARSPRRVEFEAAVSSAQAHAAHMVEALQNAHDREDALMAFTDNLSDGELDLVMDAITARRSRPGR